MKTFASIASLGTAAALSIKGQKSFAQTKGDTFAVTQPNADLRDIFSAQINVFGVPLVATSSVPEAKLIHAATIMAEYLDNDEDGNVDDPPVLQAMIDRNAILVMFADSDELERCLQEHPSTLDPYWYQDLQADETKVSGRFDAALEEVFHIITTAGYIQVYDDLSLEGQSSLFSATDAARGGRFETAPTSYPSDAWYTYDDETCNRVCNAVEYIYWGITTLLGAQADRCDEIAQEWKLCTASELEILDPTLYELLTRPEFKLPTILPDGVYREDSGEQIEPQPAPEPSPTPKPEPDEESTPSPSPEPAAEPRNGEEVCEGQGFNRRQCESIYCCGWDDGECWSFVGDDICYDDPQALQ